MAEAAISFSLASYPRRTPGAAAAVCGSTKVQRAGRFCYGILGAPIAR